MRRDCAACQARKLGAACRSTEMAVLLRAPHTYLGLLEHAFQRAGIPSWFDRGTRRPDPSGRAFLALLACADEDLSARRFAEYLSLGQVPPAASPLPMRGRRPPTRSPSRWCPPTIDRRIRIPKTRPASGLANASAAASWPARFARRGDGRSCWSSPR